MAESDPEPEIPSDSSTPKNLTASLFNFPNFLAGFGTKISPDSDSIRSPTSPLEIGVFSNFRKPVVVTKYGRSSSEKGYKKQWNWNKVVGLGIVNSLFDDSASKSPGPPNQKNVIFGPQVKSFLDSSSRSKSLPTNYVASRLSRTKRLEENAAAPLCFSDSNVPSSLAVLAYDQIPGPETKASLEEENSPEVAKHSTVPIPIVGSLSAREIELSEDYTCIISHGPNPKTIHIFGDCVLERHANNSDDLGQEEESRKGSPRVAGSFDGSDPVRPSDEVLTFCHSCKRKFEEGDENLVYRGDKAFCSFDCFSGNISEEETEMGSSFHEDLFLLGMSNAI